MEDYIVLALDGINLLDKKYFGSNVAIKVDIFKAFDYTSWSFILAVLHRFGF